ncbi:MAG: peptidoglycan DD-metalloendopeptidase family protein [Anaerolineales bacterium]
MADELALVSEFEPEAEEDAFTEAPTELTGFARVWADVVASGWREAILRYASHALALALIVGVVWIGRSELGLVKTLTDKAAREIEVLSAPPTPAAAPEREPVTTVVTLPLSALPVLQANPAQISRLADPHTLIPTRGRSEVITYTVARGDTLFGIAENFGIQPETVLWGNYFTLKDDPHLLFPGQVLNILPVDGTYHYVTQGNTLEQVAKFYGVTPQEIVDWPSNRLDQANPTPAPDTWLVIPGGHRELQVWVVPTITRTARATRANNFGQCLGGYSGAVGGGSFVWPADNHFLSGYDYSGVHHGIDIKTGLGAPIYAVDGGVVVYAGPNDYGYGNLIVIDHGNGWQSVYAHLSQWNVSCGQSVFQGNLIGLSGNTGRSSGAHLHFELRYNGAYVNPWSVLP